MLLKAAPKEYVLSLAVDLKTEFPFVEITVSGSPYSYSLAEVSSFLSEQIKGNLGGSFLLCEGWKKKDSVEIFCFCLFFNR